jgi:hypothetical protein
MDHPAGAADKKPNFRWIEGGTSGLNNSVSYDYTLYDGEEAIGYFWKKNLSFYEYKLIPGVVQGNSRYMDRYGISLYAQNQYWGNESLNVKKFTVDSSNPNQFVMRVQLGQRRGEEKEDALDIESTLEVSWDRKLKCYAWTIQKTMVVLGGQVLADPFIEFEDTYFLGHQDPSDQRYEYYVWKSADGTLYKMPFNNDKSMDKWNWRYAMDGFWVACLNKETNPAFEWLGGDIKSINTGICWLYLDLHQGWMPKNKAFRVGETATFKYRFVNYPYDKAKSILAKSVFRNIPNDPVKHFPMREWPLSRFDKNVYRITRLGVYPWCPSTTWDEQMTVHYDPKCIWDKTTGYDDNFSLKIDARDGGVHTWRCTAVDYLPTITIKGSSTFTFMVKTKDLKGYARLVYQIVNPTKPPLMSNAISGTNDWMKVNLTVPYEYFKKFRGNSDLYFEVKGPGVAWFDNLQRDSTNLDLKYATSPSKVKGDFNKDGNPDILWRDTSTGDNSIWFMDGATYNGSYAMLPTVATNWQIVGTGDFNKDGKPDILWRNTSTGDNSIWFMDGATFIGFALLPTVPTNWQIVGTADFNYDGNPDILWRNTSTGENSICFMDGATFTGFALLPTVPTNWQIVGTGDFNKDGKPDILWRNTSTGENSIWFMDGATFTGFAMLPTVPTNWQIGGTGDFNNDRKTDILWRNTSTGDNSIWFMDGATFTGYAMLPTVPTTWQIVGTADFNNDGENDILWRDTSTGENSIWFMDGATFIGFALLPTVPTNWQIVGTGDFNGDGKPDILWRDTSTGENSIWFMDGATFIGFALLPTVPTNWQIVGTGDFNNDGKADILWRNTSTGENSIWFMTVPLSNGSFATLPTVAITWQIVGTGDCNYDGENDILWRNTSTGDNSICFMDGATFIGYAMLPTVPTTWQIVGTGDFNDDGKPDILWRNTSTGENSIWFMDGATFNGSYAMLPTVPLNWQIVGPK